MTHTGGESATSGFREQMSGQLRAARVLTGLLERGDREGLPVLEWTISHNGAQVKGRSYAQPGSARRAALAAWAAALGITLGEEYHQDSRMTTITGTAKRERTRHGPRQSRSPATSGRTDPPGGEVDLAGEVVAGGPLSPLSIPRFPGARVFSVSSAGECLARRHMISYRNDNGTWLNVAEDHALALATSAHSPGWTLR